MADAGGNANNTAMSMPPEDLLSVLMTMSGLILS